MNGKSGEKTSVAVKQGIWATGQIRKMLDEKGVVVVKGKNPEFKGGPPYYVYLGLRVGESGPVYWEIPHRKEGDKFFAKVYKSGSFDIYLKAQSLSNQEVTIVWWACSQGNPPWDGPTGGPTPIPPPPTIPPIGLAVIKFKPEDFPGRSVAELPGIDPKSVRRLTAAHMGNLAVLASADATHVAGILGSSEVNAMGLIFGARSLLQGNRMP